MLQLLEYSSTLFFIIGAFLYSSRKASKPKIRSYGLFMYSIGGFLYIAWCAIAQAYGFLFLQVLFEFFNYRGIYNCYKESKDLNEHH